MTTEIFSEEKYFLYMCAEENVIEFYDKVNTDCSKFNLYITKDYIINPWEIKYIDLGIKCMMKSEIYLKFREYDILNDKNISYNIYANNNLINKGLILLNGIEIIDKTYRDNIKLCIRYIPIDINDNRPIEIKRGENLFFMCVPMNEPINLIIVNKLN